MRDLFFQILEGEGYLMKKNRFFNLEKAQGMVEFALVLPILLLVILGIIGFGHMFFSYSATVSASREAARYGAAAGISGSSFRFQDCDGIRAAAVRAGLFAGVANTEASVNISYDEGPGTAQFGSCPVGGTGPNVALGDRILITVVVPYRSIVPLVNIPSFNLTATTRRTIVRSLSIGDAPTAEPVCPLTEVYLEIMGEDSTAHTTHSVVGQPVPLFVAVTSEDGTTPDTDDGLYLFDSTTTTPLFSLTGDAPSFNYSYTYMNAGDYLITGEYIGDIDCYDDSALTGQHTVDAAETTLEIIAPIMDAAYTTLPLTPISIPVDVSLGVVAPGYRASWEGVEVFVSSEQSLGPCTAILDAGGNGSCSLTFNSPGPGLTRMVAIRADFPGDTNYQLSYDFVDITITEIEPTLVPTTTLVPTSTPSPTATPGSSDGCPYYLSGTVNQSEYTFSFQITNPASTVVSVSNFSITWPSDPIAELKEVRFDWAFLNNSCTATTDAPNCLWFAQNVNQQVEPPSYSLANIQNSGDMNANYTYTMLFDFSYPLTTVTGNYRITVGFNNTCPALVIDYTR